MQVHLLTSLLSSREEPAEGPVSHSSAFSFHQQAWNCLLYSTEHLTTAFSLGVPDVGIHRLFFLEVTPPLKLLEKIYLFYCMHMHVRSGHMSLYASCTCLVISWLSENIKSPRTRVTDDCEP